MLFIILFLSQIKSRAELIICKIEFGSVEHDIINHMYIFMSFH
jgi:hypothetical protein